MTWKRNLLCGLRTFLQSLIPLTMGVIIALSFGVTPNNIFTVTEDHGKTTVSIGGDSPLGDTGMGQMVGALGLACWALGPVMFIMGLIEVIYSFGAKAFGKTTYKRFPWDPQNPPGWCLR